MTENNILINAIRTRNLPFEDKNALMDAHQTVSYKELWRKVEELHGLFSREGIGNGKVVAVCNGNSIDLALIFLGLLSAGASPLIIGKDRIHHIPAGEINIHSLILPALDEQGMQSLPIKGRAIPFDQSMIIFNDSFKPGRRPSRLPGILVTSSGTTHRPKVIILSMEGILHNISSNSGSLSITEKDISLQILPLGYSYGLIGQFLTHLYNSATIVFAPANFYLLQLSKYIHQYSVTTLFTVPPILRQFLALRHPADSRKLYTSLRLVTIGGNHVEDYTVGKAIDLFGCQIVKTYGLAEAGPRVCTNFLTRAKGATRGVGKPIDNVHIRVLDPSGKDLAGGRIGRIMIEGPSVSRGYLNRRSQGIHSEKAVLTRDYGYLEEDGNLIVLGRKNEFLALRRGKLWFSELESTLYNTGKVCKVATAKKDGVLQIQLLLMSNQKLSQPEITDLLGTVYGPEIVSKIQVEFMTATQLRTFK